MWERQSLRIPLLLHTQTFNTYTCAHTHTRAFREVQMHTVKAIQTFTGPGSQTEQRRWITSQSCSPGLIMTSACHNTTILQLCHKCRVSRARCEFWTCVFFGHVRSSQMNAWLSPSYIEMMCGWRRDDMISISLRMWTMSCSSLIFSFRIDLIATWRERTEDALIRWRIETKTVTYFLSNWSLESNRNTGIEMLT